MWLPLVTWTVLIIIVPFSITILITIANDSRTIHVKSVQIRRWTFLYLFSFFQGSQFNGCCCMSLNHIILSTDSWIFYRCFCLPLTYAVTLTGITREYFTLVHSFMLVLFGSFENSKSVEHLNSPKLQATLSHVHAFDACFFFVFSIVNVCVSYCECQANSRRRCVYNHATINSSIKHWRCFYHRSTVKFGACDGLVFCFTMHISLDSGASGRFD